MYKRKVNKDKSYKKFNPIRVNMDTMLSFGKYKYLTIRQIVFKKPKYILWLLEQELIIPKDYEIIRVLVDNELLKDYDFKINKVVK
jgi:hypothetical protein